MMYSLIKLAFNTLCIYTFIKKNSGIPMDEVIRRSSSFVLTPVLNLYDILKLKRVTRNLEN